LANTKHTQRARKPEKSGAANTIRPRIACSCNQTRIEALLALKAFDEAYSEARQRFIEGEHDVTFPVGTYQLRILYRVCVGKSAPT